MENDRHKQMVIGRAAVPGASDGKRLLRAVQLLSEISARHAGSEAFFEDCVAALNRIYATPIALIAVFSDSAQRSMRTLAVNRDGRKGDNFSYELAGSPCEQVLIHEQLFVPQGVVEVFPHKDLLRKLQVQSYFGSVLSDADGEAVGVLVVLDTKPMHEDPWLHPVLGLFADRVSYELERCKAERELKLAASVFERSHQGIMITDHDDRIIKVNNSFSRITGYSAEQAEGQPASLLASGRHEQGFFDEMHQDLENDGYWQGELWNRRQDGEVYPEQRVVSVLRDARGEIEHYVSIFSDISAQKYAAERIHRLAHYDVTTDLPNRLLFQDFLTQSLVLARRNHQRLAVLFVDLDGFKLVNDTLGHPAGDSLLRQIAERLSERLRESDMLARVGGDEFALALTEFRELGDVAHVARDILDLVAQPALLAGQEHAVTASIGIAIYPDDGKDVAGLMKAADAAMYQAKAQGKARYAFFESEMNRRAEEVLQMTAQLRRGIDEQQFQLHFQPQYDLGSGAVCGVEALLRWQHGDDLVLPGRFIPVSEESGLILPLGRWVLNHACAQARLWLDAGVEFGRISVNVSGRQMRQGTILDEVKRALADNQLPPRYLELELTESWIMEEPEEAIRLMGLLRKLGVRLAIDDFGVAHSSMNYLKRFPVSRLKIDRSFIRDIPGDRNDAAIAEAMIAMGHSLQLCVVAEGVETPEQRRFLADAGCDIAQGFLYSEALPAEQLQQLITH